MEARRPLHDVALGLLATAVVFPAVALTGRTFVGRDLQLVYVPLRAFLRERLLQGDFPEWYPYDGLGQSFVAMTVSGTFHPLQALNLVLGDPWALKLTLLGCFPLAYAGAARLARRVCPDPLAALVAGLAWAFGGPLVSLADNLLYLVGAATLPWALLVADAALERWTPGRVALAALVAASILFAGDALLFAVALAATLTLGAARRQPARALGLAAAAVAVGAAQWAPALLHGPHSQLARQTAAEASAWSLHPLRLGELLLGSVFTLPAGSAAEAALFADGLGAGRPAPWLRSVSLGAPLLVLAAVGAWSALRDSRAARWVAGLGAALWLLALGRHGGLWTAAWSALPFTHAFRYPEKLAVPAFLAVCLALAWGVHRVRSADREARVAAALAGTVAVLLCALAGAEGLLHALSGLAPAPAQAALRERLLLALPAGALASALLAATARLSRASAPAVLAASCFGLLVVNALGVAQVGPPAWLAPSSRLRDAAQREVRRAFPPARVDALAAGFRAPDEAGRGAFAQAAADGLQPLTPALAGVESAAAYLPAASREALELRTRDRARYDTLASVVAVSDSAPDEPCLERDAASGLELCPRVGVPRVRLTALECAASPEAALARAVALEFDYRTTSVADCVESPARSAAGSWRVERWEPERQEVVVEAPQPTLLVLADAWAPGWWATVDGEPARLWAVNAAFRGVPVPRGTHRVALAYRTPGLTAGASVSLGALAVLAALALAARWRARGARA